MKLIIQVPCWNEESSLPVTLRSLPSSVEGFDSVDVIVVDDGSSDRTREVAEAHGVEVVSVGYHQGLARTFMVGICACLERGADVIVNTDADNQYSADDIPLIVEPILAGDADLVVGSRPIASIQHFSLIKKLLQVTGSYVVGRLSGTAVRDAPSGFRAISRQAALSMNVFDPYTYTLETLIQAGQKGLRVRCVPIRVNKDLRPSRLVKSVPTYVLRSLKTIARMLIVYKPFRFFMYLGTTAFLLGVAIGIRFLFFYFTEGGDGRIQSLILGSLLMTMGFQTAMLAVIADLLSVNRRLIEDVQRHQRDRSWGEGSGSPRRTERFEHHDGSST